MIAIQLQFEEEGEDGRVTVLNEEVQFLGIIKDLTKKPEFLNKLKGISSEVIGKDYIFKSDSRLTLADFQKVVDFMEKPNC